MKIRGDTCRHTYDSEHTIELPSEKVTDMLAKPLIDLNLFIGFLKSHNPECIDSFTKALVKHLKSLTLDSDSEADFVYESEHLSIYPEVEDVVKQVTLGLLNYSKYEDDMKAESCKILFIDYLKSCVPTNYWTITALADVLGRDEALALYKLYVDYRTDNMLKSRFERLETLEEYYEGTRVESTGPHDATYAMLEGGMVVARIGRCMWHEVQKEFGDGEIAYTNSCFYDYYAVTMHNENFELTRTKTLMQGDKYCDFCWHDKRIDKTMEHPSEEFFESL